MQMPSSLINFMIWMHTKYNCYHIFYNIMANGEFDFPIYTHPLSFVHASHTHTHTRKILLPHPQLWNVIHLLYLIGISCAISFQAPNQLLWASNYFAKVWFIIFYLSKFEIRNNIIVLWTTSVKLWSTQRNLQPEKKKKHLSWREVMGKGGGGMWQKGIVVIHVVLFIQGF